MEEEIKCQCVGGIAFLLLGLGVFMLVPAIVLLAVSVNNDPIDSYFYASMVVFPTCVLLFATGTTMAIIWCLKTTDGKPKDDTEKIVQTNGSAPRYTAGSAQSEHRKDPLTDHDYSNSNYDKKNGQWWEPVSARSNVSNGSNGSPRPDAFSRTISQDSTGQWWDSLAVPNVNGPGSGSPPPGSSRAVSESNWGNIVIPGTPVPPDPSTFEGDVQTDSKTASSC